MRQRYAYIFLPVLAAAVIAAYWKAFGAPFILDDRMYIVENGLLRDLSNLWPPSGTRYVGYLSFALNYSVHGLSVFGFHAVNIAIHLANSLLVFLLVRLTFETPWFKRAMPGEREPAGTAAAALTALVFALHPVQTEAVTYISQRFASLAALFYLLSIVLYARWRTADAPSKAHYALALVAAILAQKTKEISFTLPFVIVLYEAAFISGPKGVRERALTILPFMLTALIIPVTLFANGSAGAGSAIDAKIMEAQLSELKGYSKHDYLVTQFRVIATYLRLLVAPVGLNLFHDVPLMKSLFRPDVLLSLLLILSIAGAAAASIYAAFRRMNAYLLLAGAGAWWFFITLSIESSIIPIRDVIFEHRLYLPLAGASLTFVSIVLCAAGAVTKDARMARRAAFVAVAAALVPLGVLTFQRNALWADLIAFYEDAARKSPGRASVHYDLGKLYRDAGRAGDAVREYRAAIAIKGDYAEAHANLGNVYLDSGLVQEAVREYSAALSIDPADAKTRANLGNAYSALGMLNEAGAEFMRAIEIDPMSTDAYNSLGNLYLKAGQTDKAHAAYSRAVEIDPAHVLGRNNLGNVYFMKGEYAAAAAEYERAVELKPDYEGAWHNLGLAYSSMGRSGDAIAAFEKAIVLKPGYGDAHFSLGLAYRDLKRLDDAVKELRIALRIEPDDWMAVKTLGDTLYELGRYGEARQEYAHFAQMAPPRLSTEAAAVRRVLSEMDRRGL